MNVQVNSSETNNNFQAKKVGLIAFSHFTHDVYTSFLAVLLPFLIVKFSLSYSSGGFLYFLLEIPSILIPLISLSANKFKMKYIVILAPAVSALAMSFVPAAPSFWNICVLLFIAGLSSTAYHIPSPVMIKSYSGGRIGAGMSYFAVAGELARTVGPLYIAAAVSWWGLEGSFRVVVPGLLTSLMLYFTINKLPEEKSFNQNGSGFFSVLIKHYKIFIPIAGFVLFKAFLWKALTSFLPVYMTGKGLDIWFAVSSLAILELSGAAGAFLSGSISDKIGRKKMLLIIAVSSPLIMYFFILSSGWASLGLLVLLGALNLSANPVLLALVQDYGTENPTAANSIFMAITFVISSVSVYLFGFLSDLISLESVYYLSAGIFILGIPFLIALPKEKKESGKIHLRQ